MCPLTDCLMLGTDVDLQQVENSVFAMEMVLKAWLQEQGGDGEHLHLLLPNPLDNPIPGTDTAHKHTCVISNDCGTVERNTMRTCSLLRHSFNTNT